MPVPGPARISSSRSGGMLTRHARTSSRVRVGSSGAGCAASRADVKGNNPRRLSLARALACNPDCLLLDEPTSALDTASKGGVERLVRSLADEAGLTVVLVTHDPAQANELADRIIAVGAASP